MQRCSWAETVPAQYQQYHDSEWGKPVRDDKALFERICLEGFQAGLSWWSVLSRRTGLRTAFADFDPQVLRHWGDGEVEHLMADTAIIRNRAKIRAVLTNARIVADLAPGALTDLIWSFQPAGHPVPNTVGDLPASSAESVALARALKTKGMVFIGPTTAYALMQACGVVNDHLATCAFR